MRRKDGCRFGFRLIVALAAISPVGALAEDSVNTDEAETAMPTPPL